MTRASVLALIVAAATEPTRLRIDGRVNAFQGAGGFVVAWGEVRDALRHASVRRLRINAGGSPAFGEALEVDPQGGAYLVFAATTRGVFGAWTQGTRTESEIRVQRPE